MSTLFSNEFLADIRTIQSARNNRQLVVFAGAGVSKDSGVPLWSELTADLKKDLNAPNESDDLKIAQLFYNQRKEKEYNERIRSVLKYNQTFWNPLHKAILDLNPEHIITTNYDNLFEQAIQNDALSYSIIRKDEDLPYAINTNLLIKMHGDFDELNMVLKEDDYLEYNKNFPLIESFIKAIFASKLVLFIGFSFSDINLKFILQKVRSILGGHSQPAYLLTHKHLSDDEKKYLELKGIKTIVYNNTIHDYINQNKLFLGSTIPNSSVGLDVFRFIKFIDKYDIFKDSQVNKHIIDQTFNSLERFDEIMYLPSNFYTKIFPFNTPKYYGRSSNANWLITSNSDLSELIKDLQVENTISLPLKDEYLNKFNLSKVSNSEEKIFKILHKLNISRVFFLNSVLFNTFEHSKKCSCLRCSYFSFNFKEVFRQINQNEGNPKLTEFQNELIRAYTYCLVDEYEKAYVIYRDIANKSWSSRQYITYFLCKLNSYWMRNFLIDREQDDKKTYNIFKELEEIDLNRILNNVPVDFDTRNLIISLKENQHFDYLEKEIKECVTAIKEKYNTFAEGDWKSGGKNVKELEIAIEKLHSYFFLNSIFHERFSNHIDLVEEAFEGIVASLGTDNRCKDKIEDIELFTVNYMILHCGSKHISDTLKKYKIKNIILRSSDLENNPQKKLIELYLNFFTFLYNDKFGRIEESEFISTLSINSLFFRQSIQNIYKNFLLFLGYIDIDIELGKEIIDPFLKSQQLEISFISDAVFLDKFLIRWLPIFTPTQIHTLLRITMQTWYQSRYEVILCICWNIKNYTSFVITDSKLLDEITRIATSKESSQMNLLPYGLIVDDTLKVLLTEKIEKAIEVNFNANFLFYAMKYTDSFPLDKYWVNYYDIISKIKVNPETSIHHFWENEEDTYCDWRIDDFLKTVCNKGIQLSKEQIDNISTISPFYQWILNPDSFDYSSFNQDWFTNNICSVYLKKMSHNLTVRGHLKSFLHKSEKPKKWLLDIYFEFFS